MNKTQKIRVIFMGTPDFAVDSAQALKDAGIEIAAVVTVPDKPAGRGLKLQQSAMKAWALENDIRILQPADLRDAEFLSTLKKYAVDLFIVVAFRILPREVFEIPRYGTINLHASLLPKYRGAAPINWVLIEGERETGVTTFLIDEKVDTGSLLLQKKTPIGESDNFGDLYARLKKLGSTALVETVLKYTSGEIQPRKQKGPPTRAPKLIPELRQIDWSQSAEKICNLVRGLSPIPAALTQLNGKTLKVFSCDIRDSEIKGQPGIVSRADAKNGSFEIGTGAGLVCLREVQLEGKKRMTASEFLRGYKVRPGDVLGA